MYNLLHLRILLCICVHSVECVHTVYNVITVSTFTFMHLADALIQSDIQCIQVIHFLSVYVFPGN